MCSAIDDLHAFGASTLRVLDAGCGPSTWLNRVAAYVRRLGFDIEAVGVDISAGQPEIARTRAESSNPRDSAQHSDPLPWPDRHFHIVLCNYAVLNHHARGNPLPRFMSTHRSIQLAASGRFAQLLQNLGIPQPARDGGERIELFEL
jgi:SAM-dependent methyltransferase